MDAIIYTTNTGSTEQYAKLLAQKTGLPTYSLAEAKKRNFVGAEAIYLGWIMAGSVKGYAEAAKNYRVCAVCGVGMGQTGTHSKCCSRLVQYAAIRIRGGNDNDVSEMRKRNEKRLSVQQQGRCVKFCKRSAENRDDGDYADHSLKGKGGVF